MERLRLNLIRLRRRVEQVISDYKTPSIGQRPHLYMSNMIDDIANVRPLAVLGSVIFVNENEIENGENEKITNSLTKTKTKTKNDEN